MLPIIFLDCMTLKNKDVSSLFVAIGMDGNRESIPIAFGFAVSMNERSWTWFLERLSMCIRDFHALVFITKFSSIVESGLSIVFPGASHGYCSATVARHLCSKIKGRSPMDVNFMYWVTCRTYKTSQFNEKMSHLLSDLHNSGNQTKREWLENLAVEKWARAFFPIKRYGVTTFPIPNMITRFVADRSYHSVLDMNHWMIEETQRLYMHRRDLAGGIVSNLVPYAQRVLGRRLHKSSTWIVHCLDTFMFEVIDASTTEIVDLEERTCSCGKWRMSGIPCSHALASTRASNQFDPSSMVILKFTSVVYRAAYNSEFFHPFPTPDAWEVPEQMMIVLPPPYL